MYREKFNKRLTLILIAIFLVAALVVVAPRAYASIDPNQTAEEYTCELYEMWTHETGNSQKMTYMDYRAITCTTSKQYQLQQDPYCVVNEQGFLMYRDNWYVVAMGSYWGKIGDKFIIHLENGELIPVILGDMKADVDTDELNYAHEKDGHVVEFLIDSSSGEMIRRNMNNIGLVNKAFPEWDSKIVSICKMEEKWGNEKIRVL